MNKPLSPTEEIAMYGEPLSASAIEFAQERVCADLGHFADFLGGSERDPEFVSAYFGPITIKRLVGEVLLNPKSNHEQLAAAAQELRRRYLEEKQWLVKEYASAVMEE